MASKDLSIVQHSIKGQQWSEEYGRITNGDLGEIPVVSTDSNTALNALPTPFARFFVVRDAFDLVLKEQQAKRGETAGLAYHRLVSDTLDVFELLYNLAYHQSRWGDKGMKTEIREWNRDEHLKSLKALVPKLGHAVETYIGDLLNLDKLHFVVLTHEGREYLLGATSPYTGFITPPDLDKKRNAEKNEGQVFAGKAYSNLPRITRKNNKGTYFHDTLLFGERDKDFKNYMFHLCDSYLSGEESKEEHPMRYLRDYIKETGKTDPEIVNDWKPEFRPVMVQGEELVISGLPIMQDSGISTVNFLSDTIVKVPFRISEKSWKTVFFKNDEKERDYDYLIPVTGEGLDVLDGDFKCEGRIINEKSVRISFRFKGEVHEKTYFDNDTPSKGNGRIISTGNMGLSFDMGIFPNILSPNMKENNYFKVYATLHHDSESGRPVQVDALGLDFFKKGEKSYEKIEVIDRGNKSAKFGLRQGVVRSRQEDSDSPSGGSKVYEMFDTDFDAVRVELTLNGSDGKVDGMLFPIWEKSVPTDEVYTYAVDLGTTNTYISCTKEGKTHVPEQLNMDEPMVTYLHSHRKSAQHSLLTVIENGMPEKIRRNFSTEFAPALIDGEVNRFPVRTALCKLKNDATEATLFNNRNIAFFYEKSRPLPNQSILTDIKWENNEKELRVFIRELLLIIKTDVLQKNGLLAKTRLVWFRPLSFKGSVRDTYNKIWKEEAREILGVPESQIECISESEAPYYYFNTRNEFNSVESVSIVDIGGGSTDFIYFSNGIPRIANSVHFGCDVMWGGGFDEAENSRKNGIFCKNKDIVLQGDYTDETFQLNHAMLQSKEATTKDIINFWISNEEKSNIIKTLRENYKPLFLYHFASIVFFMAKMYKAKGLDCPRCVLFCGNGSRYIDRLLTSDRLLVSETVTDVFKKVYGTAIKEVQVILPEERKEATCYGGLFRQKNAVVPQEFNYQGEEGKEYQSIKELSADFPVIRPVIEATQKEFHALYSELLNKVISREGLGKKVDRKQIMGIVNQGISDSLDKNFKNQVLGKFDEGEEYHDSLFFLPVIDNIFKLTQL